MKFLNFVFQRLSAWATWKYILLGIGIIVLFNVVLLPGFPKLFGIETTEMFYPLDIAFAYTPYKAYVILENLTDYEQSVYRLSEIFIDWPYALFYGWVYALILIKQFQSLELNHWKFIILIPLFTSIFDILENAGIIIMISIFPKYSPILAFLSSSFSTLKWIFAFITLIAIIAGLILNGIQIIEKKEKNEK